MVAMPTNALREAAHAFNQHQFHRCHELLEEAWRVAEPGRRPLLQGLLQVACAYLKAEQGARGPALRLFDRALRNLSRGPDTAEMRAFRDQVRSCRANLAHRPGGTFEPFEVPAWPEGVYSLEALNARLYNTGGGNPMLITRRFRFSAAHRYYDEALSPEENARLFGKCAGAHGHGHNYVLDVAVRGPLDPRTGMIVNLKDLKAAVEELVVERYDFKHLNFDTEDFLGTQPTCEQLAVTIWNLLEGRIPGCELARIRLYESDELFVEYEGR